MQFTVNHSLSKLVAGLDDMSKQVRYAAKEALNKTAADVQTAVYAEMRKVFDRPTPYTMRSLFIGYATKQNLVATIDFKDDYYANSQHLLPQTFGGQRTIKRFEYGLQAYNLMPQGTFAVPAAGAKLDNYGNVSKGQIMQILSQLKIQLLSGSDRRASGSVRSNRTIAKQGVTYFAVVKKHGGLVPGIWLKRKFGHGTAVKPVFLFVNKATYKTRLNMFAVGKRVMYQNFDAHYKTALAWAIANPKPA